MVGRQANSGMILRQPRRRQQSSSLVTRVARDLRIGPGKGAIVADLVTAAVALGTASQAASRLLGPTLDHYGERLLQGAKASPGFIKVLLKAESKVGSRLGLPGTVAPRVAREVLEQAWWTDDEVCAEYLAGVLACARTEDGKDDRALPFAAMIGRLSSFELRTHYILYRATADVLSERGPYFGVSPIAQMERDVACLVPYRPLLNLVSQRDVDAEPDLQTVDAGIRSLDELSRENLIQGHDSLDQSDPSLPSYSFRPTRRGFELFLWGLGLGHLTLTEAVEALNGFIYSNDLPYLPASAGPRT